MAIYESCRLTVDRMNSVIYTPQFVEEDKFTYNNVYQGERDPQNCTWSIEASLGKIISVKFKEFEMKAYGSDRQCEYHWLQVYDGHNSNSANLGGRLCDYTIKGPYSSDVNEDYESFESTGNKLYLTYNRNDKSKGKGFILSYIVKGKHRSTFVIYR